MSSGKVTGDWDVSRCKWGRGLTFRYMRRQIQRWHRHLQPAGGSLLHTCQVQLVAQEGGPAGLVALGHMTHLHGPPRQLKAVQLLQSFLSSLCVCKLTWQHVTTRVSRDRSALTGLNVSHTDDEEELTVMKP